MAGSRNIRVISNALGAIIAPLLLISVYLLCSRRLRHAYSLGDYAALIGAVGLGSFCVSQLPVSPRTRWALLLGYVPLCTVLLVYYIFVFVGLVFGDWL